MNDRLELLIRAVSLLALVILSAGKVSGMSISGPVLANSVKLTGDVSISTITISSLTVTNFLNVTGKTQNIPGTVAQILFSSSTNTPDSISSTDFQPVTDFAKTITLTSPSDYVRISLSGFLNVQDAAETSGYLTIMRDGTVDLGNTIDNTGIAIGQTNDDPDLDPLSLFIPVGITITDAPGDTLPHTYQVYLRTSTTSCVDLPPCYVSFGIYGYLLLEEIRQ